MDALEDRQTSTEDAMNQIEALVKEKTEAERERERTGLDINTFSIYWFLRKEGLKNPEEFGKEINDFSFTFIAPLGTHQNNISHKSRLR